MYLCIRWSVSFLVLPQEEVGQHRAKVARARDGIEKMKQEKEVLAVQVKLCESTCHLKLIDLPLVFRYARVQLIIVFINGCIICFSVSLGWQTCSMYTAQQSRILA